VIWTSLVYCDALLLDSSSKQNPCQFSLVQFTSVQL